MTRGFRRTKRGFEAAFSTDEAALLRDLAGQVQQTIRSADRTDPVVSRLFPDGHRDDPAVAAAYRDLVEDDLRQGKLDAARVLDESLSGDGGVVLDDDGAQQWLTALNDIRLALGTRLGVTEQTYDEIDRLDPEDPHTQALYLYEWLGLLQESLVTALLP